ncbi:ATP-binding cassette sub-family A member 5 [Hypsibius exemplaris]|uniref:ATP-binding cassette sub-family A member 5 n=1 Tax=Hypsibius exemplaris TaxID=2072580 RepID=A0A1W0W978_HYPEX|nr:ATP-binding cassette sub-family A member 5 [Hypsibius exemplaris]
MDDAQAKFAVETTLLEDDAGVGLILLGLIMTSGTQVYHAPAVYEFKVEPFAYPRLCGNYKDNKTHFTVGVTPDTPRIRSVMNLATDYWLDMSTAQGSLNQSLDQYSDQCADQCSDQCSDQYSDQCSLGSFLEVRSSSPEDGVSTDDEIVNTVLAFLLPFYSFFGATIYISLASEKNEPVDPFDWASNVPVLYVGNAVQIPLLILLIAFLESRHFNQSFRQTIGLGWLKSSAAAPATLRTTNVQTGVEATVIRVLRRPKTRDVRLERERAEGTDVRSDNTYAIILRTLLKTFGGNRLRPGKPAVNNVSMVFPKGEVFGLLGPNGAGKTTTLSMITGEVTPTSGDIHINGFNMHTETDSAIQTMGSCPQSDTIWDELTMEEHLTLFATLNDLNPTRSADSIKTFTEGLCITEHMKKKAAALSGGTKRKLTFVISMIGNPPLVLLDEPSTGMDPQSKRNFWDMIMQSFGSGDRGAILTTHSMEEADALCNRIGIIVQGRLQCVGSSQHLKGRFGSGYTLDVKLGMEADGSVGGEHATAVERLKHEIDAILPGAVCVEEFYNRLVFAVPKEQVKSLGVVFTQLDRVKELLNLTEYDLSQTTIEQVFMYFARMQAPEVVVVPDDLELKGQYASLHNTTPLHGKRPE